MDELFKRIRARRKELKMSQEELAAAIGYTDRSVISRLEKGEIDLPQSKISMFAKALDTTPEWLMGWTDREKPAISVPEHHAEQVGMNTTLIFSELFKRMGLPEEEAQRKAEAAKELASLSDGDMDFILSAIRMAKGKKE